MLGHPQGAPWQPDQRADRGAADLALIAQVLVLVGRRRQLQRRMGLARRSRCRRSTCTRTRIISPAPTRRHRVGRRLKVKRWKVGDEVVIHCNRDDGDDEECNGGDPMFSPSQRIWGYETPDGSFAQFARVQDRQLLERPASPGKRRLLRSRLHLHRMLFGHRPYIKQAVTCWCGAPRAASARWRCN
jgi:hypothetical protein